MKTTLFVACVCLLAAGPAAAQEVRMKKAWAAIGEELKAAGESIEAKCGAKIALGHDKASWKTVELVEGPARWCTEIANALASLCEDADYKDAVAKKIKKVTCINDESLKTDGDKSNYGNKHALKGSELSARYNKDSANISDKVREFLKNAL